jgi:hypothetical protein
LIKQKYIETPILISPNWQVEFHVHTNPSLLAMGVMLSMNIRGKSDQPIVYTYRLLNREEHNHNTIEKEALTMVFSLHKFKHYLLGNKFIFYVDHMALVYLVNKPQILRKTTKWLLLSLKYDFIVVYKLGKTHVITNALSKLLDITKPIDVPNQTTDANLFYTRPEWLNDVKEFLKTSLKARYRRNKNKD